MGSNTWLLRVLFLRRPQRLCQGSQCWVLHTLISPGVPMPFCQASPRRWMCHGGTGGVLTKQSAQKPKLPLFALCAFQYHPESSTYWATSTLGSPQSWSKVERVLSFQNVPKGCEKCWWLCTPHRPISFHWWMARYFRAGKCGCACVCCSRFKHSWVHPYTTEHVYLAVKKKYINPSTSWEQVYFPPERSIHLGKTFCIPRQEERNPNIYFK